MSDINWVTHGQNYHLGDTGIRIEYVPNEVSLAPFKLILPECLPRYYDDLNTAMTHGERKHIHVNIGVHYEIRGLT